MIDFAWASCVACLTLLAGRYNRAGSRHPCWVIYGNGPEETGERGAWIESVPLTLDSNGLDSIAILQVAGMYQ